MTTLAEAAELAERGAEHYRGMVLVAETLRGLGSVEQATKERRSAYDAAVKAHEAKKAEIAKADAALAKLHDKHLDEQDKQSAELGQLHIEAETRASTIVADAEKQAAAILEATRNSIARMEAANAKSMAAATKELEAARADLARVKATITQAEAEHSDLVPKIEAMRAAARGILG